MQLNRTYSFNVTTLSPVSIGNEQEAVSSFAEYIYDEETLYFIDLNNLSGITPSKIDEFIEKLGEIEGYITKEQFEKVLNQTLGLTLDAILTGERYPIHGIEMGHNLVLRRMLKTRNRPFLSGSTLKGAIKAAILYSWAKNEGKEAFRKYISFFKQEYAELCVSIDMNLRKAFGSNKHVLDELDIAKRMEKGISFYTQFIEADFVERNLRKDIKRQIAVCRSDINNEYTKSIEEIVFSKGTTNLRADASYLRVIDSPSVDNDCIVIELIRRSNIFNSDSQNTDIPFLLETVRKGTNFSFKIQIPQDGIKSSTSKVLFLQSATMTQELRKQINEFSRDFIEDEIQDLSVSNNIALLNHYKILEDKLGDLNNTESIMRIGFGKHVANSSITLLIKRDYQDVYSKFLDLYFDPENEKFPVTRTITTDSSPLGWIQLTLT